MTCFDAWPGLWAAGDRWSWTWSPDPTVSRGFEERLPSPYPLRLPPSPQPRGTCEGGLAFFAAHTTALAGLSAPTERLYLRPASPRRLTSRAAVPWKHLRGFPGASLHPASLSPAPWLSRAAPSLPHPQPRPSRRRVGEAPDERGLRGPSWEPGRSQVAVPGSGDAVAAGQIGQGFSRPAGLGAPGEEAPRVGWVGEPPLLHVMEGRGMLAPCASDLILRLKRALLGPVLCPIKVSRDWVLWDLGMLGGLVCLGLRVLLLAPAQHTREGALGFRIQAFPLSPPLGPRWP